MLPCTFLYMRMILINFNVFAIACLVLAGHVCANETVKVQNLQTLAGKIQQLSLSAERGDYVSGELAITQGPATVRLLDKDGKLIRVLVDNEQGNKPFRLVAPYQNPVLQLASEQPAHIEVSQNPLYPAQSLFQSKVEYQSQGVKEAAEALARGEDTNSVWRHLSKQGSPLVEQGDPGEGLVTFLYRGAKHNVRLLGGPANDHVYLERLLDTDIWYRSFLVPNSLRLSYQMAADVPQIGGSRFAARAAILATAKRDPLNPEFIPEYAEDDYGRWSTLALTGAPYQPGVGPVSGPRGKIQVMRFDSQMLANSRDVALYQSPGFVAGAADNLLLVLFDGNKYQKLLKVPQILDNLTNSNKLPGVMAIFVDSIDNQTRGRELPDNPDFARMLAEELVPHMLKMVGTDIPANRTIITGSSYGGLASATVAYRYPERFGNVLAKSGSFWWAPASVEDPSRYYVSDLFLHSAKLPLRFFISANLYEAARGSEKGILDGSRHLRDILTAKGYEVHYQEYAGGHDNLVWRGVLGDGLLVLFGL